MRIYQQATDLRALARPAADADPAGAQTYLTAPGGADAWLTDGVGYLRTPADPRPIAIRNLSAWGQIVQGLGMSPGPAPEPVTVAAGDVAATIAALRAAAI